MPVPGYYVLLLYSCSRSAVRTTNRRAIEFDKLFNVAICASKNPPGIEWYSTVLVPGTSAGKV